MICNSFPKVCDSKCILLRDNEPIQLIKSKSNDSLKQKPMVHLCLHLF